MAYDKQIAAITCFCEASNQPPEARRAVIHAMFNRKALNPAYYGPTIAAVCLKRMQFSEWNADQADNRNIERAASAPDSDPIMLDCAAAYDVVEGGACDPTNGATHFYADSIPAPQWTQNASFCGKIGSIMFWKNVP